MLLLCDLSNNNPSPIDFETMHASGVWGLWHKVTEGATFVDPDWKDRAATARRTGLHVGGYHFARPAQGSPQAQAAHFHTHLRRIGRRDLRPVLDLEDTGHLSPSTLHAWARSFLEHIHILTGTRALTYTSPGFVQAQSWHKTFGTGAGLWLADYGPNDGKDHGPHVPPPWKKVHAHQYTSVGHLRGVTGNVDLTHARARRPLLAHGLRGLG